MPSARRARTTIGWRKHICGGMLVN